MSGVCGGEEGERVERYGSERRMRQGLITNPIEERRGKPRSRGGTPLLLLLLLLLGCRILERGGAPLPIPSKKEGASQGAAEELLALAMRIGEPVGIRSPWL